MVSYNAVGLDLSGITGAIDAWSRRKREEDAKLKEAQEVGAFGDRLLGTIATSGGAGGGAPSRAAEVMGIGNNYADVVAKMESGGRYDAVGPTHAKLGRALGRYQVMEANVGPWTEKHLGRRLTGDQFLADREAQDAVFQGQFGEYASKHGPANAFSMWHSGRPVAQAQNARDSLGTRTTDYVNRGMAALGHKAPQPVAREAGTQQVQVASAADADMPARGAAEAGQFNLPGGRGAVAAGGEVDPQRLEILRQGLRSTNPQVRQMALQEVQAIRAAQAKGTEYDFQKVGDQLYRIDKRRGTADLVDIGTKGAGALFGGTGLEAQGLNQMVARGEITPEQASQYATAKIIADEKGQQRFVTPQEFFAAQKAAQGGVAGAAQPVAPAAGSPAAPVGGGGVGTPITGPKTTKPEKPTEAEARNEGLLKVVEKELPVLMETFKSLGEPRNLIGDAAGRRLGGYRGLTTESYQRGHDALKSLAKSYLYSVSGAAASDKETEDLAMQAMPRPGEGDAARQAKLDRVNTWVEAIRAKAGPRNAGVDVSGKPKVDLSQAKPGRDGKMYVPDPDRPGKYLRVDD
jgi:hypothetical protein